MSVLSPVVMSRSPTDSGVTGMAKDHPAMQTWMRATVGYQRRYGRWKLYQNIPSGIHAGAVAPRTLINCLDSSS